MEKENNKIDLVINLLTPHDELIERMVNRIICTNCKEVYNLKLRPPKEEGICDKCGGKLKQREDDLDVDAIKNRLQIYEEKTKPLVDFYSKRGIVRTETISQSINRFAEDVVEDVVKEIKE